MMVTDHRLGFTLVRMRIPALPHEDLFDEISNKLNELSYQQNQQEAELAMSQNEKIDRLQIQIKKFHSDLLEAQVELKHKVKSIENLQHNDKNDQLAHAKNLADQLEKERALSNQLNTDLSKSLALGLQLQIEMQTFKKNYQSQFDAEVAKSAQLAKDLALTKALKDEAENELHKSRVAIQAAQDAHDKTKNLHESEVAVLNEKIENTSQFLEQLEKTTEQQYAAIQSLTAIAEKKIIELKMQLDRKEAECRDFESHLQHALTQNQMIKQENLSLKDYISKMNALSTMHQSVN
jgi:hypothetical protein